MGEHKVSAKKLLEAGLEHIRTKRTWCQGQIATTGDGLHVDPSSADAVQFCALGALYRAAFDAGVPVYPYTAERDHRSLVKAERLLNEASKRAATPRDVADLNHVGVRWDVDEVGVAVLSDDLPRDRAHRRAKRCYELAIEAA